MSLSNVQNVILLSAALKIIIMPNATLLHETFRNANFTNVILLNVSALQVYLIL